MGVNETLLVIGYGSLLSGYGMLAERRGGGSRLVARDAFPVRLRNVRRGLAKPSSHGRYLAMDLEPIDPTRSIAAGVATLTDAINGEGNIGGLGLIFDRKWAPLIARREEYNEHKFVELIELADRAGKPLGEFLLGFAERAEWNFLKYRAALRELVGYTSEGYIFHPIPLDDGRVAIAAIGSGFEGSGDEQVRSKRAEFGMDRLLTLAEALSISAFELDRDGQVGYFVECLLGGYHGLEISDLAIGLNAELQEALQARFEHALPGERARFLSATSLDELRYRGAFGLDPHPAFAPFIASPAPK